jgi:ferric-dicitrate binding protein FerR (iron transport regulator)
MEPNERSIAEDFGSPARESDPRIHRALSDALAPSIDEALESRVALARLWDRIQTPTNDRNVGFGRRGLSWQTLRVFAFACVVVIGAFVVSSPARQAPRAGQQYETGVGERKAVTLRDGSRVTLAPLTTLYVDGAFNVAERRVRLNGEAVFDVTAAGKPFSVRTGTVVTRVLGTRFGVRYYAHDPAVQVAVVSGKVLSGGRHGAPLSAGLVADVTDSTVVVREGESRPYIAWTDGQLAFYRTPVADVLASLTRWYGYEFRFTDSTLATQNLTAQIDVRSTEAAFATLKLLLDVDFVFDHTIVTVSPRRRTTPSERSRPLFHHTTEVGR